VGLPSDELLRQLAGQYLHPRLNLEEELARFRQALVQPAIREALSRKPYVPLEPELFHDHPLAHREQQVLTHGIIDRLVILKENGKVVAADVLDFKTDQVPKNDPQALNELGRYYEPQLAAYRRAVEQAFGLNPNVITARMLFLEAGEERRLTSK
jgi:ATP-dependent exoDNAse (exonuclease V) beta subunit